MVPAGAGHAHSRQDISRTRSSDVRNRRNNDDNGGDTLSDVEWDVEGKSVFEGPDGTYIHSADDIMIIYVRDSVDCESFELTFTNETGAQGYDADTMDDSDGDGDPANDNDYPFFTKEECADDGMSVSSGDDPSGYYSIGELSNMEKGEYDVSSTYSFYTVPFFETLVEAGGGSSWRASLNRRRHRRCGMRTLLLIAWRGARPGFE